MESDGVAGGPVAGQKSGSSGFFWVSSSPSPIEIERLESVFPEVVSVPVEELKSEMMDWQLRAIIVRSFQKWVPVEAFLREFRRAGIQGGIKPISLAFRCHIFQFDDPTAVDLVMNRPWVINGQIIGMDRWKPEFVPSVDAIPSALVWMRLPNLPLEFWKEEFLRAITEAAGQFHCVDASTLAKNRGGFARICLRVDLRRPLRPGTRVQGINLPFWQQFVYEFLEGFCPRCGSLHLEGPCSVPSESGKEEDCSSPVFGSWLSAVRQRRDGPGAKREERKKPHLEPASGVQGSVPVSQLNQGMGRPEGGEAGGWSRPVKVAHRRVALGTKTVVVADLGAPGLDGAVMKGKKKASVKGEAVPFFSSRAGTVAAEKVSLVDPALSPATSDFPLASADSGISKVLVIANPFASIGSGLGSSRDQGSGDAFPGPLKRARSVDCPAPKPTSKVGNRKGKGIKKVGGSVDDPSADIMDRNSDLLSSAQTLRNALLDAVSEGLKADALMMTEEGNLATECPSDMVTLEDHGGVPASSSIE